MESDKHTGAILEPPATTEHCCFAALVTKSAHTLQLPAPSEGQKLWVLARWFDTRGRQGPMSRAVSATVA